MHRVIKQRLLLFKFFQKMQVCVEKPIALSWDTNPVGTVLNHLRWIFVPIGSGTFHLSGKKSTFDTPACNATPRSGWRSQSIAAAFEVPSLWMVCDWTSNEPSEYRMRKKMGELSPVRRGKPEKWRKAGCTGVIEMVWATGIQDGIYTYKHCSFSLSLSFTLLFFLSLSPHALAYSCAYVPTRRTDIPTAPGVTQVTHHSSCTHGNRVDSDLSPINKPFRMPTRSTRTSAMPKWRWRQSRSRVHTTWHRDRKLHLFHIIDIWSI